MAVSEPDEDEAFRQRFTLPRKSARSGPRRSGTAATAGSKNPNVIPLERYRGLNEWSRQFCAVLLHGRR